MFETLVPFNEFKGHGVKGMDILPLLLSLMGYLIDPT